MYTGNMYKLCLFLLPFVGVFYGIRRSCGWEIQVPSQRRAFKNVLAVESLSRESGNMKKMEENCCRTFVRNTLVFNRIL